jgi:TonB family protein
VIASVTSAIDTSHPYELASHASLVQLYEKKGQSDEATEHCIAIGRMTPWSDEIEPVPLYRIDPRYPEKMARKGDEGYAILEFTISSFGFVEDITIIESSHRDFEKTSLDALAKWRYAPKIEDGQAVESGRRKVKLDFTLG